MILWRNKITLLKIVVHIAVHSVLYLDKLIYFDISYIFLYKANNVRIREGLYLKEIRWRKHKNIIYVQLVDPYKLYCIVYGRIVKPCSES